MAWMNIFWHFKEELLVVEEKDAIGCVKETWEVEKQFHQKVILEELKLTLEEAIEQKSGEGRVSSLWFMD